jgi:hypothetical protein
MRYEAYFWLAEEVENHGVAKQTGEEIFIDTASFGEVGERDGVI